MQIVIDIDEKNKKVLLTVLKNLKKGIIRDFTIIDNDKKKRKKRVLDKTKGLLQGKIKDPIEYQRKLRQDWER